MRRDAPVVSVVTPFYNTADYLTQCIESVLAQTFTDFEYVLLNNCSTDGARAIAAEFASRDSRIRLIDNPRILGQVDNYNEALLQIDSGSEFVKMVQADDALMPECLRLMVEVGRRDSRIGIVSSCFLKGDQPVGHGIPFGDWLMNGRDACRRMLTVDFFPLGSPTTVMYRASIVRSRHPFYASGRYHEDTEAGFEILLEHDLGFVHQILSYLRTDNVSISSKVRNYGPDMLDHLIILERFGPQILSDSEFKQQAAGEWRAYLGFLADAAISRYGTDFWDYHRRGFEMMNRRLRVRDLMLPVTRRLVRRVLSLGVPSR